MNGVSLYKKVSEQSDFTNVVKENTLLVKKIAHHLIARLPSYVCIDDLLQAGMIGLIDAAKNYDPSKGASFTTYAGIRIRGSILDEMRKGDWAPRSVHRNSRKISKAIAELEGHLGRDATNMEIADYLDMSIEELDHILCDTQNTKIISFEDLGITEDVISESGFTTQRGPEFMFEKHQQKEKVSHLLKQLPERERLVIALYYQEELNLKEIGKILGVSESRVSQMISQSLHRLQARLMN